MRTTDEWMSAFDEAADREPGEEVVRAIQADAKAEGWREAIEAAATVLKRRAGNHALSSWDISDCLDEIRALLPPAPGEGGESGKVKDHGLPGYWTCAVCGDINTWLVGRCGKCESGKVGG